MKCIRIMVLALVCLVVAPSMKAQEEKASCPVSIESFYSLPAKLKELVLYLVHLPQTLFNATRSALPHDHDEQCTRKACNSCLQRDVCKILKKMCELNKKIDHNYRYVNEWFGMVKTGQGTSYGKLEELDMMVSLLLSDVNMIKSTLNN